MFDGFNDPGGTLKWLTAASMKLAPGTTQDEWLAAYRRDLVEDQRPLEPARCFGPREDWTAIEIDGRPAELRTGCGVLEATLFVGDRVYVFGAYATDGATPATAPLGVPEAFRQLFDAWLTTITLDPGAAVDPPETTPRPSGG